MRKDEFLKKLRRAFAGLPRGEIAERLGFYGEMIDDRMEEGLSEEQAVASVGPIDEILSQTAAEAVPARPAAGKARAKSGWKTALLILGFPVWFPLLAAAAAIVLALLITIAACLLSLWALALSLWAVEVTLWAVAAAGIVGAVPFLMQGSWLAVLAVIAMGMVAAGLSILVFQACVAVMRWMAGVTRNACGKLRDIVSRKGSSK